MVEWSKAQHWKCCEGATSPRVRIPLSPPFFFAKKMAERRRKSSLHCAKHNFTQKTKFFLHIFTKYQRSLACEVVSFR